ncbi:hypothetical protein GX888_00455 [Candidatus Dojkabacteria bacterium]|uniref:Uncharacterized protein n=1 Tax=Candidatus Dojkabacteria bacterium TaxID=2099670 RepID=A0A847VCL6_9BACT|nr:hypothetical protein [Candidatus Dojkabacteria bacterium]
MESALEKIKAIGILLLMSFSCICIVWVTNKFKVENKSIAEAQVVQRVIEEEEITISDSDTSTPLKIPEKEEEEVLSIGSIIKYECGAGEYTYIKSDSACQYDGTAEVEFTKEAGASEVEASDDSTLVSIDASILLAEVTVPLELLSGIEVADSNRMITTDTPTLKPAGEQVESRIANVLLPPGQQIEEHKSWDEDKPFIFDFWTAFTDLLSKKAEEGQIGVETEIVNECPECNNASNVNPDKSNKISEFLYDSIHKFPGERDNLTEEDVEENYEECKNQIFVKWSGEYKACKISKVAEAVERYKQITAWGLLLEGWTHFKCEVLGHPDCVKVEDIVIIMDSPFGSDKGCLEGSACTNAFMEVRNKTALPPQTELVSKYYYTTPCEAYIQGVPGKSKIRCAWDKSYLFKERKFNELDDLPTVESTPTDEEYNDFLLHKVQGSRGDAIPIEPGN